MVEVEILYFYAPGKPGSKEMRGRYSRPSLSSQRKQKMPTVQPKGRAVSYTWEDNGFDAYCKQHGSKALHDYKKMCDEIRSRLEPGEYV